MKHLVKISALTTLLIVVIYYSSFKFIDNLLLQVGFLIVSMFLILILLSAKTLLNELKLIFPFLASMMMVYLILGLIGFRTGNDITKQSMFSYWLNYGLSRTILFTSNMFFIQSIISLVSINDIISLPMSINKKKYLLLGKSLFVFSVKSITEIEFHLKLMPEYQTKRLTLKQWFIFKLQVSMALIIMVLRESKLKGELIDNRIKHCFANAK